MTGAMLRTGLASCCGMDVVRSGAEMWRVFCGSRAEAGFVCLLLSEKRVAPAAARCGESEEDATMSICAVVPGGDMSMCASLTHSLLRSSQLERGFLPTCF